MRRLIEVPFTGVVFDDRTELSEPRRAYAEGAALQSMRFAKNAFARSIVDGLLKLGETIRHVGDEQFENFSDHIGAKCPELGEDALVEDRCRGLR
jgi:hypothetical protein